MRSASPQDQIATGLIVGAQLAALTPIPMAIAMTIIAPGYMIQMASGAGVVIGTLTVGLISGGYGIVSYGTRFLRKGQYSQGWFIVGSGLFLLTFPSLWLVLLGPALAAFTSH